MSDDNVVGASSSCERFHHRYLGVLVHRLSSGRRVPASGLGAHAALQIRKSDDRSVANCAGLESLWCDTGCTIIDAAYSGAQGA